MAVNTYTQDMDNLYTTTFFLRRKEIVDQIFNSTPFWKMLSSAGKRKTQTGGTHIEIPLAYGKNETVKYFGRASTIDLADHEFLTVARFDWKYLAGSLTRYFVDEQRNRGEAKVKDMVTSKIDNLQSSLVDKQEVALFADGTGDAGMAINGLGNLVAIAPATGTVGSIDRATYSWWRNNYKNMTTEAASVWLRKRMSTMFNDCGKLGEGVSRFPTAIICAQDVYELYEDELVEIRQITSNKDIADLGFGDLAFKGKPMTWSPECPATYLYMLNLNFIEWVADPIKNFDITDWKAIPDQIEDRVAQIVAVGNLTTSNCKKHGVIFNIAA